MAEDNEHGGRRPNGTGRPAESESREISIPPSLLASLFGAAGHLPDHLDGLLQPDDESKNAGADDASRAVARRLFAGALVWLHARYLYASTVELATMANALAEAATGCSLEAELAVPQERFRGARVALAAGLRGTGPIWDPIEALQTAIAIMAEAVIGHS